MCFTEVGTFGVYRYVEHRFHISAFSLQSSVNCMYQGLSFRCIITQHLLIRSWLCSRISEHRREAKAKGHQNQYFPLLSIGATAPSCAVLIQLWPFKNTPLPVHRQSQGCTFMFVCICVCVCGSLPSTSCWVKSKGEGEECTTQSGALFAPLLVLPALSCSFGFALG